MDTAGKCGKEWIQLENEVKEWIQLENEVKEWIQLENYGRKG